jgi:hypothetical protein
MASFKGGENSTDPRRCTATWLILPSGNRHDTGLLNESIGWSLRNTRNPTAFWRSPEYGIGHSILQPYRESLQKDGRTFYDGDTGTTYELQINVTLLPAARDYKDEKDWFKRFLPGGLPGSSRRH